MQYLSKDDPELSELIKQEESRLQSTLNLIAAENHSPQSIMEALGSILNTKTIEGYPGKRFHAGCKYADEVEKLAISRGKHVFDAEFVNIQPHSGTSANLAVYFSVLEVGDRVLAMSLSLVLFFQPFLQNQQMEYQRHEILQEIKHHVPSFVCI